MAVQKFCGLQDDITGGYLECLLKTDSKIGQENLVSLIDF